MRLFIESKKEISFLLHFFYLKNLRIFTIKNSERYISIQSDPEVNVDIFLIAKVNILLMYNYGLDTLGIS